MYRCIWCCRTLHSQWRSNQPLSRSCSAGMVRSKNEEAHDKTRAQGMSEWHWFLRTELVQDARNTICRTDAWKVASSWVETPFELQHLQQSVKSVTCSRWHVASILQAVQAHVIWALFPSGDSIDSTANLSNSQNDQIQGEIHQNFEIPFTPPLRFHHVSSL